MGWRGVCALGWVAGCGIEDEPEYVTSRAAAECGRIQACSLGFFESEYADLDDCVDERSEEIEELNDGLDEADCDFVGEEAGPCVSRIRGMSCEDWAEGESGAACDLVWDCSDLGRG